MIMVFKVIKNCVEICIDFFMKLESQELKHCDKYNNSCKICNPRQFR